MDALFVANVPDISQWGTLRLDRYDTPRPHLCRTLEITLCRGSSDYMRIVHEVARSIASARLDAHYLDLWDKAALLKEKLSKKNRMIIARALARGTCRSGDNWRCGNPVCNDNHFLGHIVEVLLYCLRIYLAKNDRVHPRIFEPPRPKASSVTPGIDLLEVGETNSGYYFLTWECKGTDGDVRVALVEAASQLCESDSTAHRSFMEAYRCLQGSDFLKDDSSLAAFVSEMPRRFYESPPHSSKRLGGVVGTGSNYTTSGISSFSKEIDNSVVSGHAHCQVVIIKIADFHKFREDVFQGLWNIF